MQLNHLRIRHLQSLSVLSLTLLGIVSCCGSPAVADHEPFLVVLGTAQDAGFPQAACQKDCCAAAWQDPSLRRMTASLAIVDPNSNQRWMIDATPNFRAQLRMIDKLSHDSVNSPPSTKPASRTPTSNRTTPIDGILLTHGHIGHYTGLIHLGREVMGAKSVPVYAMPRMEKFLQTSGPWSQLVSLNNIRLVPIRESKFKLNDRISITPFLVPHRDEFTETVGFKIHGPKRSAIYLPDIDKWDRWQTSIADLIADVDIAFLDGTFFDGSELPGRNMAQIPHPFVVESIAQFKTMSLADRNKIQFIHLNHTNPLLNRVSKAHSIVKRAGHHVAEQGQHHPI